MLWHCFNAPDHYKHSTKFCVLTFLAQMQLTITFVFIPLVIWTAMSGIQRLFISSRISSLVSVVCAYVKLLKQWILNVASPAFTFRLAPDILKFKHVDWTELSQQIFYITRLRFVELFMCGGNSQAVVNRSDENSLQIFALYIYCSCC